VHARYASTLGTIALLLAAGSAAAAPIAVDAVLRIEIRGPNAVAFEAVGTGVVDVSGGVYQLPAGLVALSSATIPAPTGIGSYVATGIANLAGSFAPGGVTSQAPLEVCLAPSAEEACASGDGLGGVMALTGRIAYHVIPHIVVVNLDLNDLLIGQGGGTNVPLIADGAPWTTGTVRIGPPSFGGSGLSTTGSVGTGSLTLVAGSFVCCPVGDFRPITARLTLTPLVPEPTGLALIFGGALGLLGILRRRH
jgi:hypothetical protein